MSVNQQNMKLDSNAFEELHHTYHDRLQASVLSCVRNREEAEDITSAAFEAAFANREGFRAEAAHEPRSERQREEAGQHGARQKHQTGDKG